MLSLPIGSFAQQSSYYNAEKDHRYFFGLSAGKGVTDWYSRTEGYELVRRDGKKIVSGDHRLTAQSTYNSYEVEVLAPLKDVRVGMGIAFEEFVLYEIQVESPVFRDPISFVENFRFDMFFLQGEFPLSLLEHEDLALNVNVRGGYYGFTRVTSLSLFGERRLGATYFFNTGIVGTWNLADRFYLLLRPAFEFKHFDNARREPAGAIYHELLSYGMNFGVRAHLK